MALAYETQLDGNLPWALREGSMFFVEKGGLHDTLRRITRRLRDLNIPHAVAGD